MRIKTIHIVLLLVLLIIGFVLYATYRQRSGPAVSDPEEAFLRSVRQLREGARSDSVNGSLPSIEASADLVSSIDVAAEFHAGTIPSTQVSHVRLPVRNKGKAPLKLIDTQTSCVCTYPTIPKECIEIAPGGEGYIDLALRPGRMPGFRSEKTITVLSSDPRRPSVSAKITVDIEPEFELVPPEINFGKVRKGESSEVVILFRQIREEPIELKNVGKALGDSDAAIPRDITFTIETVPEEEWRSAGKAELAITAKLSPSMSPGEFLRRVAFATDIMRMPSMMINAKGHVESPYTLEPTYPERLPLATILGNAATNKATATIKAEGPVEITNISSSHSKIVAEGRQSDDPNTALLDVRLLPDAPPGKLEALVRFDVRYGGASFPERVGVRAFSKGRTPQRPE